MGRKMGDPNELKVVNIRMVKEPSLYSENRIHSPEDAVKVIAHELATYDREVFAVLNLKTNGQPINFNICSVGTLDASLVSPANVAKSGILSNAVSSIRSMSISRSCIVTITRAGKQHGRRKSIWSHGTVGRLKSIYGTGQMIIEGCRGGSSSPRSRLTNLPWHLDRE